MIDITQYEIRPLMLDKNLRIPRVMTVAGSDSSGGAGIEADLKTVAAHRCYGMSCINSLTAQNTTGVLDSYEVPLQFLEKILEANFKDIDIDTIKTGMLTENGIKALLNAVEKYDFTGHLVIDPVMVSTSGFELSKLDNLKLMISELFQHATMATPNFIEATSILKLVDTEFAKLPDLEITHHSQLVDLCKQIVDKTPLQNILIKGGHVKLGDNDLIDVLYESDSDTATIFKSRFLESTSTHGTGCTLASSIACNLSKNMSLVDAVGNGIIYVQNGISAADPPIGHGHGPLCHFHAPQPHSFAIPDYDGENLMDFLKNHPFVSKDWHHYTHHPFIEQVAHLELPLDSFLEYLKQDHVYLLNYAKTHCLALAISPDIHELQKEVDIMLNIIREMAKHRAKLLRLGIGEKELDSTQLNSLTSAYSEYLMDVASNGSWLEINVALSACLFGYREAGLYGISIYESSSNESNLKNSLYKEWLEDYCSEWYHQLCLEGELVIERATFAKKDLPRLLEIFGNVVKLEINFWNEFI